jgi:cytochrome b6-f complex iron-sulfur subunit
MSEAHGVSRRTLLGAAATAAISLPVITRAADDDAPKGGSKGAPSTQRTPSSVPATDPSKPAAASAAPLPGAITATAVGDGWFSTMKAADLPDNAFKSVNAQPFVLARKGTSIFALSTKCTHKGCTVKPQAAAAAGKDIELACPCHKAQFALDGAVTKPPATKPLPRYKLRLSADGLVEVNTTATAEGDGPETVLTLKA